VPCLEYYLDKIPAKAPIDLQRRMAKDAERLVERDTFGEGFRRDKNGKPVEMGRGAPGNQTAESIRAYEARCKHEPNFVEVLARMRKELAECDARRAAERAARSPDLEF
jgi:hypothetical protein